MKDLDQLKKDYKQLGKTIAELEKPKDLRWLDLKPGQFFIFKPRTSHDAIALRCSNFRYVYLDNGLIHDEDSSSCNHLSVKPCDISGNPLEEKK
jgi:hypothetical protein